jgi:hypothetical protein
MSEWISVEVELPKKTDGFLVLREVHTSPTMAVFVHLAKKWMIMVGGQYWEIVGVAYYMDMPTRHPHSKVSRQGESDDA